MGPMVLMVRTMVGDTLKFLGLLTWIILAWAFFFYVLYREKYGFHAVEGFPADCFSPDEAFEDFFVATRTLWEATLLGDGYFECFYLSSPGWLPLLFMYAFVLTSTIMLMNMLIAMMAESFGLIYGNKLEYFLFLRAKHVAMWLAYAPVPPPLNVLRLPYEVLYIPYAIFRNAFHGRAGLKSVKAETPFALPDYWLEENTQEILTERIVDAMQTENAEQLSEIAKVVKAAHDDTTQSFADTLDPITRTIDELKDEVHQLKNLVDHQAFETTLMRKDNHEQLRRIAGSSESMPGTSTSLAQGAEASTSGSGRKLVRVRSNRAGKDTGGSFQRRVRKDTAAGSFESAPGVSSPLTNSADVPPLRSGRQLVKERSKGVRKAKDESGDSDHGVTSAEEY